LVQVWADSPTRHDAGKVRISASSRTHVHVAVWQAVLPHALAAVDADRPTENVSNEVDWLLNEAATYQVARGEKRDALPLLQRGFTRNVGSRPARPDVNRRPSAFTWYARNGPTRIAPVARLSPDNSPTMSKSSRYASSSWPSPTYESPKWPEHGASRRAASALNSKIISRPAPLQRDHRLSTSPNSRRGLTPQTMGCLTLGVLGALRSSAVARSTCVCAEQQHDRGQAVQDNDGRHHIAEDRLGDPTFRTHGTVDRLPTPPRRTRR
jgi:hypothetical protein